MAYKKILVAYFSRDGHTKRIAQELAKAFDADIDRIIPERNYSGKDGYNRAAKEAFFRQRPQIKFSKDPSAYDLVIIGTPMWAFTMSSPVRSYITMNKSKIKDAAFFFCSGSPLRWALGSMQRAYGRKPVATLHIRQDELSRGIYVEKENRFVEEIKSI